MTLNEHAQMVRNLADALQTDKSPGIIETHISSVIVGDEVVFKLKKPVDFGFLDYSTLQKRKTFCEEEVRINRMFAPDLYYGAVSVNGSVASPSFEGEGDVIDYAVKMRRFDQQCQLDEMADSGSIGVELLEAAAQRIAAFHEKTPHAGPDGEYGIPHRVLMPMRENFELLRGSAPFRKKIETLEQWSLQKFKKVEPLLLSRKKDGFIRECHGDLHLHNMAYVNGKILFFDAIEFNPYLNRIDVISDLAFLLMDLEHRGLMGHAARVLNRYLEERGDYEALALLDFYKVYRAMVRAKVAMLRSAQDLPEKMRASILREVESYLDLAIGYTQKREAFMGIMHGLSGSGKSTFALLLVENYGAVRIRSDVERMRLFRGKTENIYAPEVTGATYIRLYKLAKTVYGSGFPVVIDATFLKSVQRKVFLGAERAFYIFTMECDLRMVRERVSKRSKEGTDISEADTVVLETQISYAEALSETEKTFEILIDCTSKDAMLQSLLRSGFFGLRLPGRKT